VERQHVLAWEGVGSVGCVGLAGHRLPRTHRSAGAVRAWGQGRGVPVVAASYGGERAPSVRRSLP